MKKIGIIGGIGPESTVDYYKRIITAFQTQHADLAYPEVIIYSANLNELLEKMEKNEWDGLTDWLVERVQALARAGADFAAIGSNTPHIVFDAVKRRAPIPMLSIIEETCRCAERMGLKRLGLLGTKFTMESDFFQKPFLEKGMSVVVPDKAGRQLIHHRLFSEIELGIIKDSTRDELLSIARQMIDAQGIDGLILGCTELPLILDRDAHGIPFLNTTAIHAESIVKFCVGE